MLVLIGSNIKVNRAFLWGNALQASHSHPLGDGTVLHEMIQIFVLTIISVVNIFPVLIVRVKIDDDTTVELGFIVSDYMKDPKN